MIYSDRERLGISILCSFILFLVFFLMLDLLIDINFPFPEVVRPPLIVTFYEEKPAPQQKPVQESTSTSSSARSTRSSRSSSSAPSASDSRASTSSVPDSSGSENNAAPVDWGDNTAASSSYVPAESSVDYGAAGPPQADTRDRQASVAAVTIEEVPSRLADVLARIGDRDVSGSPSSSWSAADSTGTNESIIRSDTPQTLDEITVTRRLLESPKPLLPDGFSLGGKREVLVDVYFEILPFGNVTNLHIITETGYSVLDRAILDALEKWRFVAVSGSENMKVRMSYRVRAR